MLVLLPPSETKADGGVGAPLDLDALSFPDLNPVRRKLADNLVELAADVPASMAALGLTERQDAEVARNARLFASPTMPALHRYTGVLYDRLRLPDLPKRAQGRVLIASALWGVLRPADRIPYYDYRDVKDLEGHFVVQADSRHPTTGQAAHIAVSRAGSVEAA